MVKYEISDVLNYLRDRPVDASDDHHAINFSDIPELTEKELKRAKRPRQGRPLLGLARRKTISIKIDPVLLARLKSLARARGTKYQTLTHEILENYVMKTKKA